MRRRGFWIGWVLATGMVFVSGVAFVDTAHPVTAGMPRPQGTLDCPTGVRGVPSTCAEVHAAALAAGTMSRANFDLAQSFAALAAHSTTP